MKNITMRQLMSIKKRNAGKTKFKICVWKRVFSQHNEAKQKENR